MVVYIRGCLGSIFCGVHLWLPWFKTWWCKIVVALVQDMVVYIRGCVGSRHGGVQTRGCPGHGVQAAVACFFLKWQWVKANSTIFWVAHFSLF